VGEGEGDGVGVGVGDGTGLGDGEDTIKGDSDGLDLARAERCDWS
jgi:hypothetical protein